jgi:hypothetical protein
LLKARFGRHFDEVADGWALQLRDAFRRLEEGVHPRLPTSAPVGSAQILEGLKARLLVFDPMKDAQKVDKLAEVMRAVHDAGNATTHQLFELRRNLILEAENVVDALDGYLDLPHQEAMKTALEGLQAYKMEEWARAPRMNTESLVEALIKVTHEIVDSVRAVPTLLPPGVQQLLADRSYVDAAKNSAEAAAAEARAAEAAAAQPSMDPAVAAAGVRAPQPTAHYTNTVDLPVPGDPWADAKLFTSSATATPRQAAVLSAIKVSSDATWQRIAARQRAQTLGAGATLILAAALIFGDTFVGTSGDYIKLFLWGFTTDVGFNTLIDKVKNKIAT